MRLALALALAACGGGAKSSTTPVPIENTTVATNTDRCDAVGRHKAELHQAVRQQAIQQARDAGVLGETAQQQGSGDGARPPLMDETYRDACRADHWPLAVQDCMTLAKEIGDFMACETDETRESVARQAEEL